MHTFSHNGSFLTICQRSMMVARVVAERSQFQAPTSVATLTSAKESGNPRIRAVVLRIESKLV